MNPNKPSINVSLTDTNAIVCEQCSSEVFTEGILLRSVSKFLVGTDKDALIPVAVFMCAKCHHINEQFLPKNIS